MDNVEQIPNDVQRSQPVSDQPERLNELIGKWLIEWRDMAKRHGSKMEFVYGKALKSLYQHTEPLSSGEQCRKLKGFGDKICAQIDNRIDQHFQRASSTGTNKKQRQAVKSAISDHFSVTARKRPIPPSPKPTNQPGLVVSSPLPGARLTKMTKTSCTNRRYIPAPNSSPFAILVALLRLEMEFGNSRVNKLDLQKMAQLYVNNGLTWQPLNTLISKQLVQKTDDRYPRYCLTQHGKILAKSLALACSKLQDFSNRFLTNTNVNNQQNNNQHADDQTQLDDNITTDSQTQNNNATSNFFLPAGSFEIILCIDSRERYSNLQGNQNRAAFHTALQKRDVKVENRTLPLGDFVWVAREKKPDNLPCYLGDDGRFVSRELVLDYIIERKRIDDLASSIRDRRWNEQKFRLRNCGLRRPMYLIEYLGKQSRKQDHGFFKAAVLDQAISNCEIDGFEIKLTDSFEETVRYLANMSRWLQGFYADKAIFSCRDKQHLEKTCAQDYHYLTFNEFSLNATKIQIFTAGEMFIKHLLQMKGMSMPKVLALITKYPTIRSLMDVYLDMNDHNQACALLADIHCQSILGQNRRFGPALSRKMFQHYCPS